MDIEQVVSSNLEDSDIKKCIETAINLADGIIDRNDLHKRDYLEKFNDIVMGEIAEQVVLKYLHDNNKYAESAVDKHSGRPDAGHDIIVKYKETESILKCSVKSSLSATKSEMDEIIKTFQLASKPSEMRDINIQVYFWLKINTKKKGETRVTTPSVNNMAIIGWAAESDFNQYSEASKYATEKRTTVNIPLKNLRPMSELLTYLMDDLNTISICKVNNGDYYHRLDNDDCSYIKLNKIKNNGTFIPIKTFKDVQEAENENLKPCNECF